MIAHVLVTPAEIQRARLVVKLNESLQRATPAGIRKIAEATPRTSPASRADGTRTTEPDH